MAPQLDYFDVYKCVNLREKTKIFKLYWKEQVELDPPSAFLPF